MEKKKRREKGDVRDLNRKWNIAWTEHQTEAEKRGDAKRNDRETGGRIGGGAQTDEKSFSTEMRGGQNKE